VSKVSGEKVNQELLTALQRICAEAESWHTMHGHDRNSVQCDSICQLIPEMQRAIRRAHPTIREAVTA
jgi:uncharacterized membrane protein YccC